MSFAVCFAECYACQMPFMFNPNLVPSLRVEGVRQPVCRECVERANPERIKRGLEPITVLPGAYDPVDASEL
jgi:hypothetical protein